MFLSIVYYNLLYIIIKWIIDDSNSVKNKAKIV